MDEIAETRDYVAAQGMNFARHVIDRADDKIGSMARRRMLDICDAQPEMLATLRKRFETISTADAAVLASPEILGMLRGQILRRLAHAADGEHARLAQRFRSHGTEPLISDERVHIAVPASQLADNPNAFRNMARYLIITAEVNDQFAKAGRLVEPASAAAIARQHVDDLWKAFQKPEIRRSTPQQRLPRP